MITLTEIQAAVDALAPDQKQELFLWLAAHLRADARLPPPRELSPEQLAAWIADDELGMQRLILGLSAAIGELKQEVRASGLTDQEIDAEIDTWRSERSSPSKTP